MKGVVVIVRTHTCTRYAERILNYEIPSDSELSYDSVSHLKRLIANEFKQYGKLIEYLVDCEFIISDTRYIVKDCKIISCMKNTIEDTYNPTHRTKKLRMKDK